MPHSKSEKIALFLPSLFGGGAERMMLTLARGFSNRGYNVDLVFVNAEGPFKSELPNTVNVVNLSASRYLKSIPKMIKYLRQEKPDILLSTKEPTNLIAYLARLLSRSPCKLFLRLENNYFFQLKNSIGVKGLIIWKLTPLFYPRADGIIAISQGIAADIKKLIPLKEDRIQVIYNPVNTESISRQAKLPFEHPWLGIDKPPVILGIGRLTKQKDFPTLIQAFALLRKKISAHLIILGEGEDRSALENLVERKNLKKDVEMPGFIDNPFSYLSRASVFVLSSAWEGFGNVVLEALVVGTAVVATDCPYGPKEILDSGRFGQLTPVSDPHALADAILQTLSHRPDKAMLQTRASQFSESEKINEYLQFILN